MFIVPLLCCKVGRGEKGSPYICTCASTAVGFLFQGECLAVHSLRAVSSAAFAVRLAGAAVCGRSSLTHC